MRVVFCRPIPTWFTLCSGESMAVVLLVVCRLDVRSASPWWFEAPPRGAVLATPSLMS